MPGIFYLLVSLVFLALGSYGLYCCPSSISAIHSLVISLYFYVIYFEIRGRPFSGVIYLLLIALFLIDGLINLYYFRTNLLTGIISLFFAYFSWRSYQRIAK